MATTILAFRMTGDTASFIRSWKGARTTLTGFSKQADVASKKLGQLGRAGFVRFTLPVVAGLGVGVKAFSDFDQALNESLAIIDDVTTAQRKQLSDLAKQMSGESTFAAKELAEGYFFLASAGLDVEQSLAALPVVTTFAQAGMFDLATATDLLTDAYSALGPQIQGTGDLLTDMTTLSDILVKANTLANASVSQFAEALTTEAGTAMRAFRIDVEDGVSVLAAFADQGIKGNIAGSLFARATRLLAKAALENKEAFKEASIAVFDANGEFRSFADIASDLEQRFEGMSVEARTAELKILGFAARTQQAILPLIGMSEKLRQLKTDLEDAGGKTQDVAERQLQSFANQMKLVRNEINLGAIALGESLAPRVLEIARHFSDLSKQFQSLSKEQRNSIINWALLAAGIPVALLALAGILKTISILTTVVKGLNIALAFLAANPVVALAVVVAAATVIVFKLVDSIKEWRKAVQEEQASLDRLSGTLAVVEEKYGSLENLRRMNRDRWEADARAREEFNKVLKEEIGLQKELETLEANLSAIGLESEAAVQLKEQIVDLKNEIEDFGALKALEVDLSVVGPDSEAAIRLKNQIAQLQLELGGLDTAGFERKIEELKVLEADLTAFAPKSEAAVQLKNQIADLESEIEGLDTAGFAQKIVELEGDLTAFAPESEAASQLREQITGLKNEIEGLDTGGFAQKIAELEGDLAAVGLESQAAVSLREQITGLKNEIEGFNNVLDEVLDLQAKLQMLEGDLAVVEPESQAARQLKEQIAGLKSEIEGFNDVIDEGIGLETKLKMLEVDLSAVSLESQAAGQLKEQIAGLESEIENLDTAGFERKIKELEAIASRSDLSSTVVKGFREQINSLKAELAVLTTEEEIGFALGEADFAAAEEFRKALSDAAFEQLDTEQKINELLRQRIMLGARIEDAQKDSKEFFNLRKEALKVETQLLDLVEDRKEERKDEAEAQFKTDRFVGAVEAGSVAEFQARLRGRVERQDLEKLAKKRNAELEELNGRVEENTGILREAVDILVRDSTTTVTIA